MAADEKDQEAVEREDRADSGTAPPDVPDEDLPEDVQPTDDNPLAQSPEEAEAAKERQQGESAKVEGMPDMGQP